MKKFETKFAKRLLAYVLTGAMLVSSMTSSDLTAFASETAANTAERYQTEASSGNVEETPDEEEKIVEEKNAEVENLETASSGSEGTSAPAGSKPAPSTPVESEPASSSPVESEPTLSSPVESEPASSSVEPQSSEPASSVEPGSSEPSSSEPGSEPGSEVDYGIVTEWDFADEAFTDVTNFKGLLMSGVSKNKTYALAGGTGELKVPVAGPCTVTASYCYSAAGKIENSVDISLAEGVDEAYGSTSKTKSSSYAYTGKDSGYVTIKTTAQTYFTKITVAYTEWDFADEAFTDVTNFKGLLMSGVSKNKTYALAGETGELKVPVAGPCTVTASYCYSAAGKIENSVDISLAEGVDEAYGSTSKTKSSSYDYKGEGSGYVTIKTTAQTYFTKITISATVEDPDDDPSPRVKGKNVDGKPDVWDFAAGAIEIDDAGIPTKYIDTTKYNNMLTEDIMNTWYGTDSTLNPGDTGANLSSFTVKDEEGNVLLAFNGNAKTNHRIRSKNAKITRNDESTKKVKIGEDENGNDIYEEYLGYVYSNSSSEPKVYLQVKLDEGDIVTVVVGSNGGASLINFESMDDESIPAQSYEFKPVEGPNAAITTFYAPEAGDYKIYSANEKLVVARLTVEQTDAVTVSGTVTAPASLTKDYGIMFTSRESGAVKVAPVKDGKYSIDLNEKYTYDVSLSDANGYVVGNEERFFKLEGEGVQETEGKKSYTYDVAVKAVDLVTVTGAIKGLDTAVAGRPVNQLDNLKLTFESDTIYIPELTVNADSTFTLVLEKDVTYAVTAEGVDDFELKTTTISAAENKTADIEFAAVPVYDVTIAPEGITEEVLAKATVTFSRVYAQDSVKAYEEDYVYTFTGTEGIKLRDGQYEVKVTAEYPYKQLLTPDLQIKGAAVTCTIKFSSEKRTKWDFTTDTTLTGSENGVQIQNTTGEFEGLIIDATTGKFDSKNRTKDAQFNNTTKITVPVTGACTVVINVYANTYKVNDTAATDKITTITMAEAGNVVIESTNNTYLNSIEVIYAGGGGEYKDTITVGAKDCDYTTINDALEAVRKMNRTEGGNTKRVTIAIQPGDYEEMLVIDTPNVTLKNTNANPSITPVNKGVDIDASSVRITGYYGHGYAYYSMGSDCKWNADILAVNKANGYLSFENPGTGTTSGSYWNATVVINADGVEADGIIFENSFNQYVSKKAAEDIIVPLAGAKGENLGARNEMKAGSTQVQYKDYVERAAALAIYNNCKQISFNNCSFIGRQDTLYGGTGTTAAFYGCDVYGGTDYIFGGMTAVFAKCGLLFNTNDQTSNAKNDVGYITAPQQSTGRGYLLYNCTVTSTTPGVNTASTKTSKPGYLGRPWTAKTGEALFYKTVIEKTYYNGKEESLILPLGWLDTLSGKSALSQEYASKELAAGVDNSKERADWSSVLAADENGEVTLADGNTKVTDDTVVAAFLGNWNPFAGKDMTVFVESSNRVDPDKTTVDSKNKTISLDSDKITVDAADLMAKGKKQQWKVTVTYTPYEGAQPQELTEGVHYKVVIINGDGVNGKQTYYVEGTKTETDLGIFTGKSKAKTYMLYGKGEAEADKDITKQIKGLSEKSATYTGTYITPGIDWKNGEVDKQYYKAVYKNNVNVGKASVTVIGQNGYYGTKTYTFTIKAANINTTDITSSNLKVTKNEKKYNVTAADAEPNALKYTGNAIYFNNLSVKLGNLTLKEGSDYTITYKNNAKVGKASATIKASNNFTGSVKLDYVIEKTEIAAADIEALTDVPAEYTLKKGPQVLEIAIPDKGVTLKSGTDFKADYKKIKDAVKNGEMTPDKKADIEIKGAGAYKDLGTVTLHIQVIKGDFHIKSGVIVDRAAIDRAGEDPKKLIAATKITDAAGTKPTATEITGFDITEETVKVKLTSEAKKNFNQTTIACHVATKLSSVVKQTKTKPQKYFDGVNKVTLTPTEIKNCLEAKKGTLTLTENDFVIVSYKNNHKVGTATVTIQGADSSAYCGTMNLKFNIITEKKPTLTVRTEEGSGDQESGSAEESGSAQESGSVENSDVESSSEEESDPDPSEIRTVWMVGDSTMCSYLKDDGTHSEATLYYPRYGYGTQLQNYLDKYYKVNNLALSGRSSKSFLAEANYTTLQNGIGEGDVLIIGWGHNDEKTGDTTYTAPNGTSTTEGSFAKSLYDNYIKLAKDKGAYPILCTPIVRRNDAGTYENNNSVHVANGGDYAQDIIKLGAEVNVPVIDLTTLTKNLYISVGTEGSKDFHSRSTKDAGLDNTHLNIYGAKKVAYMLAMGIKETCPDLNIASHIKNAAEPTKEADLVPSPDYKEPEYTPPEDDSILWSNYGIFKGSAFGSLGKAPSQENKGDLFTIENKDGKMHLAITKGNGKISANETGMAMYYYRIPSDAIFTLSAKATVNAISSSVTNPGQAGFGLIARDNMFIDTNDKALKGDYVAAGTLMDGSANCFYQRPNTEGKELVKGTPAVTAPSVGDVYELSIRKNPDGDGYTCKFGDNPEQTGGFDFQLNSVDTQYQYIGMFVSRNADITFSDIKLVVNGMRIDIMTGTQTPDEEGPDDGGSEGSSVAASEGSSEAASENTSETASESTSESASAEESSEVENSANEESSEVENSANEESSEVVESSSVESSETENSATDNTVNRSAATRTSFLQRFKTFFGGWFH